MTSTSLDEEFALNALDDAFVAKVEAWLCTSSNGVLVLTQTQTGCGVTHMLQTLQTRHDSIFTFVTCQVHPSRKTVLCQQKVVLLDPPDADFADPAKLAVLANVITSPDIPVVIAGFKRRSVIAKLNGLLRKSTGPVVRLDVPPISDETAVNVLRRRANELNVHFDAEKAWKQTHDLRHCMESMAAGTDVREILPDGTDGLHAIMQQSSRSFEERCRIAEGDSTIMIDGAFENYVHGIHNIDDASGIMDALALADHLETLSFANPTFDPSALSAALAAGMAVHNVHLTRKIQTFKTVWARTNHRFVKHKQLMKLAQHGIDVDSAAFIRSMATASPDNMRAMARELGENDLWTIMKLWPPVGKTMTRKRFRTITQSSTDHQTVRPTDDSAGQ